MSPSFRKMLWEELLRGGLLPSDEEYVRARAAVAARGSTEWDKVRRLMGDERWQRANELLQRPYVADETERILGFGWWLSRFLVAPLGLPQPAGERVAELGALANFIVAVYDHFLDSGPGWADLLPPGALDRPGSWTRRLRGVRSLPARRSGVSVAAPAAVMVRLVDGYFHLVGGLPHARERRRIRATLQSGIVKMYRAENDLARGAGHTMPAPLLRRKAALPFVVMGLPGWLAVGETDPRLCAWHIGWMYRVGTFIGWVDDAVDLADDVAAGRPNLVSSALQAKGIPPPILAARIAGRGVRCLREWRERVPRHSALEWPLPAALPATVYSWFGATRVQH